MYNSGVSIPAYLFAIVKNNIQFENRALQVHLQLIENTTAVIHKHISDRKHIHNMFDNTAIAATNNDFSTFGGQMCERSIKIHEIVLTRIVVFVLSFDMFDLLVVDFALLHMLSLSPFAISDKFCIERREHKTLRIN